MKTQHTPGPWLFQAGAIWNSKPPALTPPDEKTRIATVHSNLDGLDAFAAFDAGPDKEAEANARLIAAAPELAEALRDVLWMIQDKDPKAYAKGRAVLAKLEEP